VARVIHESATGTTAIQLATQKPEEVRQWAVQSRVNGAWRTSLLPGAEQTYILKDDEYTADFISVTAVDRTGNVSTPTILRRPP
jgi:hypothetical protein